jgi:hypothetical protein
MVLLASIPIIRGNVELSALPYFVIISAISGASFGVAVSFSFMVKKAFELSDPYGTSPAKVFDGFIYHGLDDEIKYEDWGPLEFDNWISQKRMDNDLTATK